MSPTGEAAPGDPCLTIFLRLAELGAAGLDLEPCEDLMREVLTDLRTSGRISDFQDLVFFEDCGRIRIRVDVSWDRGFQGARFECLKSALTPELGKVAEIMYS